SPVPPHHRDTMHRMLAAIAPPKGFAFVQQDGEPLAMAIGVVQGDHMGLFDVLVMPRARRRGLARHREPLCLGLRTRRPFGLPAGGGDQRGGDAALRRAGLPHALRLRVSDPLCALTLPRDRLISRGREEHKMPQHPWETSYPPGVSWELDVPKKTIHQIFEESCAQYGDRPFTDFLDKVMSFRDYKEASDRAAAGFQKLGVKPGVNVGLYLPNSPHYLIAFFGVLKAGGKVVNYSPLDAARELEFKIGDSETDFLVTLDVATLYPKMA